MKTIKLLSVIIIILGTYAIGFSQDNKNVENDTIDVYYFHNTRRCATCNAVEDVTKQTLEQTYPDQMKNGSITFQSLNLEEDSTEPIARKLHVSGQTLLFVKNGKKKDLTNEAFMYAKSKPDKLKEKIITTITKL